MKAAHHALSLHPLAACLALVLGASDIGAAPPGATAIVVQNCLDHGPGSLRQAVIDDTAGTPIDLTQLACSTITLTTGRIDVQRALLIQGPGPAALTISGAGLDRVFNQNSTQPLALYGMTIQNGYANSFGGGCVYSAGTLQLKDTVVRNCQAFDMGSSSTLKGGGVSVHDALIAINSAIIDNEVYSSLGNVIGGGAFVGGATLLDHSTISGNVASSASGTFSSVGGIDAIGTLTMMYSTIANNRVSGAPGAPGTIGGVSARTGATITRSTISGNRADGAKGGAYLYYGGSSVGPSQIIESTISGNSAGLGLGGLDVIGPISIIDSTIAFNVESGARVGGGLRISYGTANLQSTIIAANSSLGGAQNIALGTQGLVSGAYDLIGASPSVTLPAGTIGGDPKLLPLHGNGGPTRTHALRPGSPAENAASDASPHQYDQRGTGFPRIVGARADIGAFEGVDADSIFYSGFD